jgi:hypothetical protein
MFNSCNYNHIMDADMLNLTSTTCPMVTMYNIQKSEILKSELKKYIFIKK